MQEEVEEESPDPCLIGYMPRVAKKGVWRTCEATGSVTTDPVPSQVLQACIFWKHVTYRKKEGPENL